MNPSRHTAHHGSSLTILWRCPLMAETKVFIGNDEMSRLAQIVEQTEAGQKVLVLMQPTLPTVLKEKIITQLQLAKWSVDSMEIEDGEAGKASVTLFAIWERLQQLKFSRKDTIIAIGGGTLTDIAGFAAATYLRGVNLILVPTTLLAQVDAAIGGKTAVNLPAGKNLAGTFYFPSAIVIDPSTLDTLPRRSFVSGLGEIIKYALIEKTVVDTTEYKLGQRTLFAYLNEVLDANFDYRHPALAGIITSCVKMKLAVVAKDAMEKDLRRSLNLGHTLGHALELAGNFALSHGEAVSIGLMFACYLSVTEQRIDQDITVQVEKLLKQAGLPTRIPADMSLAKVAEAMLQDKKRERSSIKMVLPNKPIGSVDFSVNIEGREMARLVSEFSAN